MQNKLRTDDNMGLSHPRAIVGPNLLTKMPFLVSLRGAPGPEARDQKPRARKPGQARKPESPKPEPRKLQERTLTTVKFCRSG
eukprot:gene17055-biopygen4849